MSGRGKAVAMVSILVFAIGIIAGVLPAQAQDKNVSPAANQIINYPGFPLRGGPYIMGATYEPGNTGGTVVIVFNEDVDDAATFVGDGLDADDIFESTSFDLAGGTLETGNGVDDNVLWITGIDPADQFTDDGTERIRIKHPSAVVGQDGSISVDMSWHTVGRGPIPERVIIEGFEGDDYNAQTITIEWSADAALATGFNKEQAFSATPELNGILNDDIDLAGNTTDTWVLSHAGTGDIDFGKMIGGVTKLWIASGAVRFEGGGNLNRAIDRPYRWTTENTAPYPIAAYYRNFGTAGFGDDEIWVLFNEAIDPATAAGALGVEGAGTMFEVLAAGNSDADDGNVSMAFPGTVSSVVKITGITSAGGNLLPGALDELRYNNGDQDLADYQGVALQGLGSDVDVPLHLGPGIVRVSYDQGQTPNDFTNDKLTIWFNEPLHPMADIDTTDFRCNDEWEWGTSPQILVEHNVGGLGKVTITNFSGSTALPGPGSWIRVEDDGSAIQNTHAQDANFAVRTPITDESRPSTVNLAALVQNDIWHTDYEDPKTGLATGAEIDELFFNWYESGAGPDDSDQYFMFITKTAPADIDNDWMNQHLSRALPLGNKGPGTNGDSTWVSLLIKPDVAHPAVDGEITETTDQVDIEIGDQLYILVAAADWTGNAQYRSQAQGTVAMLFSAPIWVGGMCPPVDFNHDDHDLIHVIGTPDEDDPDLILYQVFGDTGAVPCVADSIKAYYRPDIGDPAQDVFLGHGPVNADGSFPPFDLIGDRLETFEPDQIYLSALLGIDETDRADWCEILFDRYYPEVEAHHIFDPWNPYQIYKAGDYLNIRLLLDDMNADYGDGTTGRNSLAHVVADFSLIDSLTTDVPGFSAPPSEIVMVSLGADRVDNNNNWDVDFHDTGYFVSNNLAHWDGTQFTAGTLIGAGNALPDYGDPYIDENGNGQWDPGETFWHVQDRGAFTGLFHMGEPNLDANDPDEHGWYEVRSTVVADRGTIKQGYPLTEGRIRELAYTDPFSLVRITLQDNALDPDIWNDAGARWPATRMDTDYRSLAQSTLLDGTDPTQRFLATLDSHAPTVSKITELYSEAGAATDAADNLIEPGSPVYSLGRYVDLTVHTPSDDDVIMAQLQLSRDGGTNWHPLTLDPPGNANADLPDMDDPAVAAIVEQAYTTTGMDPVNCENDYRDNNNNAYFTYDIFGEPGMNPSDPTDGYGVITWWNIDETGECAGPANLNPLYYIPSFDDTGDGIHDGEAVELEVGPGTRMIFGDDPAYAGSIWVAAAKVLGQRTHSNTAINTDLQKFYANSKPYTDVVPADNSIMTYSERRFGMAAAPGYDTDLALIDRLDAVVANEFNWYDTHGSLNIDMEEIAGLFDLTSDGTTEYMFRAVLWDVAGNSNEDWAQPVTFTFDLTPPIANIEGCDDTDLPADSDFADVNPDTDIVEIYDAGTHPGTYTLRLAEVDEDVVEVRFYERRKNIDGTWPIVWDLVGTDVNAPFTMEWPAAGEMFTVNNYPADRHQDVQFRALAMDAQNNWTDEDDICIFDVRVIDGTVPSSWIRGVYLSSGDYYETDDYTPLGNVVQVPPDPSVNIWIRIEDNDEDDAGNLTTLLEGKSVDAGDLYTTMWAAGLDGVAGDPGDPADDVDGDGIFTWGIDNAGPDGIPGTDDDSWNGLGARIGLTDDYITNDVKYVVTEYRRVNPPGEWTQFASIHGDDTFGNGHVYDYTQPMLVTLDTQYLADTYGEGIFELRAWACDVEGNCNVDEAPIATIVVKSQPLRAYIQPPVCDGPTMIDLYAVHYLHDYEIDKVRFEYYSDDDDDQCANDGNDWTLISIDNVTTGRGDAVLYMPPAEVTGRIDLHDLVYASSLEAGDPFNVAIGEYWFYDADGDGYSPRDPIVLVQHNVGTVYEEGTDIWILGDGSLLADGVTLTPFAADEFYAAADPADPLGPETWIFRENALNGINGVLDLWTISWDATGLPDGNYLVRAIAIDAQNNMDQIAYTCYNPAEQNPPEIELVYLNSTLAEATITAITLDTGDVLDVTDPGVQYVPGNAKWARIEAEADGAVSMLFEYSLNGGASWEKIQVNPDKEWYADIDGIPGYNDGDDAVVIDVNGDFVFNAAHDFIVSEGWADIPEGWPLMPLVDPAVAGDPADTENPNFYTDAPFYAFFMMTELPDPFLADMNVMFRATPYDMACNDLRVGVSDVATVIFGENVAPEADVILVTDADGVELDMRPPIHDGDGVVTLGGDVDTVRIFVTAMDMGTLERVELWYRVDPGCHEASGVADLQYQKMPDEWTVEDDTYPYQFNVAVSEIPDGNYQFYPRAFDQSGNFNLPPENPWGFKKFSLADVDFAYVSVPEGPRTAGADWVPAEAAAGDEFVFHGMLENMDLAPTTAVRFYFAPRILDEVIDPAMVFPLTQTSEPLEKAVLGSATGDGVVLTINGELGTWHEDLTEIAAPTKLDFTVDGNAIVFGAGVDADDVILVSYNFGNWTAINTGDSWEPYTVAWTIDEGGVPDPVALGFAGANAYDLIAIARYDVNGDGEYDGNDGCDFDEDFASEGNYLLLLDIERPLVILYGLGFEDLDNPSYPDWNWPGNPLFRSHDNLGGPNYEVKLSGIETDIFVVAADQGGGEITAVDLEITSGSEVRNYSLTPYLEDSGAEYIHIPITFYEDDYPLWLPHSMDPGGLDTQLKVIENVVLHVTEIGAGSTYHQLVYDEDTHSWSGDGRFTIGAPHTYQFIVDLRGDEQEPVFDSRNNDGFVSSLDVPELPFWYLHIDNLDDVDGLTNNAVHRAVVTAWDDSGNYGTNLNSGMPDDPTAHQGPIVFIHDRTAPVVQEIFVTNEDNQPLNRTRISPSETYRLWATINDLPFDDINVMTTAAAIFQYSPNEGRDWLDLGWDNSPEEGWFVDFAPDDPRDNGYNDTPIAEYWFRVIPIDDGNNLGYSDRQDPPVLLSLTVDAAQPDAEIIRPVDGQLLPLTEVAYLETSVEGDWLPSLQGEDVERVLFQVKFNHFFWVKDDPADAEEYYRNGYHTVWDESDPGAPQADREYWFDLDATPFDNSDNPWLGAPNFGDNYLIEWIPSDWEFIRENLEGGDEYARIRVKAKDTAGNWNTDDGLPDPPEVLVILSDETVTRAYITHLVTLDDDHRVNPGVVFPIQAFDPTMVYGRFHMAGLEEATLVKVYRMNGDGTGTPEVIGLDSDFDPIGTFDIMWDATGAADGSEHLLFATAVDIDGNESDWTEATTVLVRIDRTPPVVNYTPIDPGYPGFVTAVEYHDDGIPDHTSWVIVGEEFTGDVQFAVTTEDEDVESMVLQWRWVTDPAGVWRWLDDLVDMDGDMAYQPNLSSGGNHYWWLHVEDFADALLLGGRMQFRVLATDEAGNSNYLQAEFGEYTADNSDPDVWTWDDDIAEGNNRLAAGESVTFTIAMQDGELDDLTRTDIATAMLYERPVGGSWQLVAVDTAPVGYDIDSGNAMWVSTFTWTAPQFVVRNTTYQFKVELMDSAGNENAHIWSKSVEVIDITAPDRTKIVKVAPQIHIIGDGDDPDVFVDMNDNDHYDEGVDFLISEGADHTPPGNFEADVIIGDPSWMYPRRIDEGFLTDPNVRNTFKVSNVTTLVARTQACDEMGGSGVEWVTFVLQPVDANGSPVGAWHTLGRDEYAPGFPLYYWYLTIDTQMYPDGRYKIGAYARDAAGNEEDTASLDWSNAIMIIDNTDPEGRMVATAPVHTEGHIEVERNSAYTLLAETLMPGTTTPENNEDNAVNFFYKRSRDLNMAGSWAAVPADAGVGPEDGLPDLTRPYSFDVNMAWLTLPGGEENPDPTDPENWVPLAVGENYDFIMDVEDEVGNTFSHIEAFADDTTIGPRHITVKIVDTIAPHLQFTELLRALPTWEGIALGDDVPMVNPTRVHAQAFEYIEAKLPGLDLDMAYAEFVYRKMGDTSWNLIDATLEEVDLFTWRLGPWDLRTLEHGEWYEVAVIGVDDVGNADPDPDILHVYVDFDAPPFAMISPAPVTSTWCNGIMDLVVEVERGATQVIDGYTWRENDDVHDVIWQWKPSAEVAPDSWTDLGVSDALLYDDGTNWYSKTLDLAVEISDDILGMPSGLYDLRAVVVDEAGNAALYDVVKNTVDQDAPDYVQISNIVTIGDDTTQDPSDQGQFTDVTAGTMVEIWGTASDDEPGLPNLPDPQSGRFYETVIAAMQFEVRRDDSDIWHDLGVVQLDPPDHGDMSAQAASVLWNTTGLVEGTYWLRVRAWDECGNWAVSSQVDVRVIDWTPPIARIVGWDPDLQPHGNDAPSWITIYAMAECDADMMYDVQFQYALRQGSESSPSGPWVNIAIGERVPDALMEPGPDVFTTEELWYTTIQPNDLPPTIGSELWLRALVRDEMGNRYGNLPDDEVPTVLVELVSHMDDLGVEDGTVTFTQVRSAEMLNGMEMVESVHVMVESPTNLILTVKMSTQGHAPRAILLSELAEPRQYPSPDRVWNYSPGVQYGGQPLGLVRSLDDPTVWRCRVRLAGAVDCTHYAFWVTALDGSAGTAIWTDMVDTYFREYPVTTALGTNGTVSIPAHVDLGASIMVPSGGWVDNKACLLVSPTMPPLISTDQARYLNPVDMTAYHLEMLSGTNAFRRGYEPLLHFKFSDEMAAAALSGTQSSVEDLTVRRWNPGHENRDGTTGAWVGTGISHIRVHPEDNMVAFRVRDLTGAGGGGGGAGTDLAFTIDGSGSMDAAQWTLQLEGIAAALEDPTIIPANGTVAVTVVQFGSGATTHVPLTLVTNAGVATTLADQVRSLVQDEGGTAMDLGINEAVSALGYGTPGFAQVIVLATDGEPNDEQSALTAADAAVSAGVESLYALGIGSGADMTFLNQIVRGNGIAVDVTTFNEFAQAVASMVGEIISGSSTGGGNVFQLFAPKRNAPVVLSSVWPHSPYVNDWWTDADPAIVAYLRDPGGQVIDPFEVELLIDDEYWATWLTGAGDAEWIRGNGIATLAYANQDRTVMELVYHHSTYPRDWLLNGEHLLTIRYKADQGTDDWMEQMMVFYVDRTAPYIEFDGGFVSNPALRNAHGYMNPSHNQLNARIYDGGMGVLFKHDRAWYLPDFNCDGILDPYERQFDPAPYPDFEWYPGCPECESNCWIRVDWGMKYDLWLVQPNEDDQRDIDEIEERILIHQGTADELEPWLMVMDERITLDQYNPATDTLQVPIPVLGGGLIKDGDILEITWYSEKTIEANSDGPGWGCEVDTVVVNGQEYLIYAHGCSWDGESQEMHIYEEGIMDWAGNTGSKYVEQRFIVDRSGPTVILLSPAGKVEPSGDMRIELLVLDSGSGVASAYVTVTDPEGKVVVFDPPMTFSNGKIGGEIEGPLKRGDYTIKTVVTDYVGNVTEAVHTVRVEAAILAMAEPKAFPNPFNPGEEEAVIGFDISKTSQVTVKVYDWAGQFVGTVVNNETWEPGHPGVKWSGQAADGTDLANGAYMCRITAKDLDSGRTRESTLKIVIWRE